MKSTFYATLALLAIGVTANAAFVVETEISDVDDNDVTTPDPNFSFGGDTTNAAESVPSPAVGITSGVSIFGGNGTAEPDTYLYTYTPGVDGGNRSIGAGTALNDDGDIASGNPAGLSGVYRVYATWPQSGNNSGGSATSGGNSVYSISDVGGELASITVLQNEDLSADPVEVATGSGGNAVAVPAGSKGLDGNQKGSEWEFLFEVTLDAGTTYTVSQSAAAANSFVSQRSSGILFMPAIPEPTSALLAALGLAGLAARRR